MLIGLFAAYLLLEIVYSQCGAWTLATEIQMNSLCPGTFQYKYTDSLSSNQYYLSAITSLKWSWSFGQQLTGDYTYTSDGGANFNVVSCTGSTEQPNYGVGCSEGGGGTKKVLPHYNPLPQSGQVTVCQFYTVNPDGYLFGEHCKAGTYIYVRACSNNEGCSPTGSPTTTSPTTASPTTTSPTTASPTTASPTTASPTTALPTQFPSESPTFTNCEADGSIKHINWNTLQNAADNSAEIPYSWLSTNFDDNTFLITFDIDLEYIGLSSDGNFDLEYNLGTTYVVGFDSFGTEGNKINEPGNCQNRLSNSFQTGTFNDWWNYSEYPYLTSNDLGSNTYLSYPPPSDHWSLSIESNSCSPINYLGIFSWNDLSECTDFAGNELIDIKADDPTSITLSGTLYVNVVSPYSMGTLDTGYYRSFPLIQQDFEISILKQINVLSSTGIDLFITSIIGIYEDEKDQSFELSVFTQTADYMQLINPSILSTPFGSPSASISSITTSCLTASTYTCGQIFTVTVNQSEISCPSADMSGLYIMSFGVECRFLEDQDVCNTFIAENGGSSLISLQVTSNFIDNTCEPEMYSVIFTGNMEFYDDDEFLIEHTELSENYVIGQDRIYVEVEVNFPDDGTGDVYNIFDVLIDNVFVCTADENIDLLINLDQQNGPGGCLSSSIDADGPYDIILNGGVDLFYSAEIINYALKTNVVRFSFLTFDIGRNAMYVHVQLTLVLQNGQRRRLLLTQNNNVITNNDNDSNQIRHFMESVIVKTETNVLMTTKESDMSDDTSNILINHSVYILLSFTILSIMGI